MIRKFDPDSDQDATHAYRRELARIRSTDLPDAHILEAAFLRDIALRAFVPSDPVSQARADAAAREVHSRG